MAIEDNTLYGLKGSQIKDLAGVLGKLEGVKTLTAADCNYPIDNPTAIAPWGLEPGFYRAPAGMTLVHVYYDTVAIYMGHQGMERYILDSDAIIIVGGKREFGGYIYAPIEVLIGDYRTNIGNARYNPDTLEARIEAYRYTSPTPLVYENVENGLTTNTPGLVLDARQGKVLNDKIEALVARIEALEGGPNDTNV